MKNLRKILRLLIVFIVLQQTRLNGALAAIKGPAPIPAKLLYSPVDASPNQVVAPIARLVPSTSGISTPRPSPATYMKNLNSWHCGTDDVAKSLSLLAIGACPPEPLNWCCFEHDRCYDFYQHFLSWLRLCDEQFGYCVRLAYQDNQFCADWLYSTHVNVVRIFGEPYKQMLVNQP